MDRWLTARLVGSPHVRLRCRIRHVGAQVPVVHGLQRGPTHFVHLERRIQEHVGGDVEPQLQRVAAQVEAHGVRRAYLQPCYALARRGRLHAAPAFAGDVDARERRHVCLCQQRRTGVRTHTPREIA
eukprot:1006315-Prymnesium_polylepis.1